MACRKLYNIFGPSCILKLKEFIQEVLELCGVRFSPMLTSQRLHRRNTSDAKRFGGA